jgi:hypothetical protein
VLLLLLVAGSAGAQRYVFVGAPAELGAGAASEAMRVRRVDVNDAPWKTDAGETVRLSSTSPGGQFAEGRGPDSDWNATRSVRIGAGSAESEDFYYRDRAPGSTRLRAGSPDGGVQGDATVKVPALGLAEDFEASRWAFNQTSNQCPDTCKLLIHPEAAHRGDGGLRVIDGERDVTDLQTHASFRFGDYPTAVYLRFWYRLQASAQTNSAVYFGVIRSDVNNEIRHLELQMRFPDGGIQANLENNRPSDIGLQQFSVRGEPKVGAWHLVEAAFTGAGDAGSGGQHIFWDGVQMVNVRGLTTDLRIGRIIVGNYWTNGDRDWTGVLDYDDVRVSFAPQAGRLAVRPRGVAVRGGCTPLEVTLREPWGNQVAGAPYTVDAVLEDSADAGAFFADDRCEDSLPVVTFPPGEHTRSAWFRADRHGVARPMALHVDFLPDPDSAPLAIQVGPVPWADLSPERQHVEPGGEVVLDALGSAPSTGATLTGFAWSLPKGPTGRVDFTPDAGVQTLRLSEPGEYVVRVSVSDSSGQTASRDATVTVGAVDLPSHEVGWGCHASHVPLGGAALGLLWALLRRRARPHH